MNRKECPTCGEERMYFGMQLLCPVCDEYKVKLAARDALRRNKKKIDLGLMLSGKGKK